MYSGGLGKDKAGGSCLSSAPKENAPDRNRNFDNKKKNSTSQVLVRRVAASEGEQLLFASSSSPTSSESREQGAEATAAAAEGEARGAPPPPPPFAVPHGHCWVLADNEALPLPAARDSRAFGPLPYGAILGRVVYAAASVTDHRPILRGGSGSSFASSSSLSGGGGGDSGAFAANGSFASDSGSSPFASASSAASRGSFDEDVLEAELDIRELAPPAPVS